MLAFISNMKLFYAVGTRKFLSKNKTGDDETLYLHCIRYYLPKMTKETFKEHNLGMGVFTMQSFERRNKQSNNTLKRFRNNRRNTVVTNLKRLYDVFEFGHNKV